MQNQKKKIKFSMTFTGGNQERKIISSLLNSINETEALVYPEPTQIERDVYATAYSLDFVLNSVVLVITTVGSLAAIAQLFYEVFRDRSSEDKNQKTSKIKELEIKINSNEIEITGDLQVEDILNILKEAKEISQTEANDWLQYEKNNLEINKKEAEIKSTKKAIEVYTRLVELFEEDVDDLVQWQIKRYEKVKNELKEEIILQEKMKKELKKLYDEQIEIIKRERKE